MTPHDSSNNSKEQHCVGSEGGNQQYLFVIRHGDRWDYANPEVSFKMKKKKSRSLKFHR